MEPKSGKSLLGRDENAKITSIIKAAHPQRRRKSLNRSMTGLYRAAMDKQKTAGYACRSKEKNETLQIVRFYRVCCRTRLKHRCLWDERACNAVYRFA